MLTVPGCCVSETLSCSHIHSAPCRKQQQRQLLATMLLMPCCQGPGFAVLEVGYVFGRWYSALQLLPALYPQCSDSFKFKIQIFHFHLALLDLFIAKGEGGKRNIRIPVRAKGTVWRKQIECLCFSIHLFCCCYSLWVSLIQSLTHSWIQNTDHYP